VVEGADFLSVLGDPESLNLMLFACPDGVIATGADDCILLYTGASELLFGFAPIDVLGEHVAILFGDADEYARYRSYLEPDGRVVGMELSARRKDAPAFTAAVSAARLEDRYGGPIGTVMYVRDHSRMRAIEEALRENNRRLHELVETLHHVARHDHLTGLLHRASAMEAVQETVQSSPDPAAFGVALFDIDFFKRVNDSHGHLVGDQVLTAVAATLRRVARHGDIVGRFGGEEFVAFLIGADLEASVQFAERARRAVAAERVAMPDGLNLQVTISAGVATVPGSAENLQDAIRVADTRLLAAKRAGRDQVVASDHLAARDAA
jgi:diguanylate cyclase (GGDEF)-like protein/PAS domain S-box-containing protein